MPCVAALLGVAQVIDVMAVEGSHTFKRPIYAGNAIITVEAPTDHAVVATVRTASWPEAAHGGSAPVEAASVDAALPTHTRFVDLQQASPTAPTCRAQRGRLRRPRARLGRELQDHLRLRRQAGRRRRRLARRGRRRLRAERTAGRPDRQDHRARSCTSRSASAARSST